ncbi:unnamed protein product [Gadus morhua 'NCC']
MMSLGAQPVPGPRAVSLEECSVRRGYSPVEQRLGYTGGSLVNSCLTLGGQGGPVVKVQILCAGNDPLLKVYKASSDLLSESRPPPAAEEAEASQSRLLARCTATALCSSGFWMLI